MALSFIGQAKQDEFVAEMTRHKRDGYFLELGANDPCNFNNTYVLERDLGWQGIMVEYTPGWLPSYQKNRRSFPVIADATKLDYWQQLNDHQFPKNIDYLQVDLDVDNRSTLTTLEKLNATVFGQYTFATMTFEHDIYTGDYFDTRRISRAIMESRGYVRLFSDVSLLWHNSSGIECLCSFEDWYVHPSLIDKKLIEDVASDPDNIPGIHFGNCIKLIKKYNGSN